jgi:hypothetical protein
LAASAERCASARTSEATTAKPRPASPGARGLDAGVQRQEVGLEGDLVDRADDLADAAGRGLDAPHRRDGLAHDLAGLLGVAPGLPHGGAGLPGAFGGAAHRGGDLAQRGCGLFQARGLLLGPPRQIVGVGRDLGRPGPDRFGDGRREDHRALQLPQRGVVVIAQAAVFAGELPVDAVDQVATREEADGGAEGVAHEGPLLRAGLGLDDDGPALGGRFGGAGRLGRRQRGPGIRHGRLGRGERALGHLEHRADAGGDCDQHPGFNRQDDGVEDDAVEARRAEHQGWDRVAQGEVVDRHGGGGCEDHAPIVVDDEERQRGEVGHVEVDLPGSAVGDQQGDLRHQDDAGQGSAEGGRARKPPGGRRRGGAGRGGDHGPRRFGALQPADGRHDGHQQPDQADDQVAGDPALRRDAVEREGHGRRPAWGEPQIAKDRASRVRRAPERRRWSARPAASPRTITTERHAPIPATLPAPAAAAAARAGLHHGGKTAAIWSTRGAADRSASRSVDAMATPMAQAEVIERTNLSVRRVPDAGRTSTEMV